MAAPARQTRISLNLLYPQGIPQKLPAKLLSWILTFGRYIAVAVEILVLVTFGARFKLDADLADVNEKINTQIPFIESLNPQEQLIRQTQFKIEVVKKTYDISPKWQNVLNNISAQTPQGIVLKNIDFDHSKPTPTLIFKLSGRSASNNDLAIFVNGLKGDKTFKDIDLTNLAFASDGLTFTITGGTNWTPNIAAITFILSQYLKTHT